jgi:hypothetical protein
MSRPTTCAGRIDRLKLDGGEPVGEMDREDRHKQHDRHRNAGDRNKSVDEHRKAADKLDEDRRAGEQGGCPNTERPTHRNVGNR